MNRLCNMLMERHMLKSGEVSTHFMTAVIQGDIFCAQPDKFCREAPFCGAIFGIGHVVVQQRLSVPDQFVRSGLVVSDAAVQTFRPGRRCPCSAMLEGVLRAGLQAFEAGWGLMKVKRSCFRQIKMIL